MVTIITTHGLIDTLDKISFKRVQDIVGGYVEHLNIPNPRERSWGNQTVKGNIMLANEEGRIIGLNENQFASQIFGSPIVGDVVLLEKITEIIGE